MPDVASPPVGTEGSSLEQLWEEIRRLRAAVDAATTGTQETIDVEPPKDPDPQVVDESALKASEHGGGSTSGTGSSSGGGGYGSESTQKPAPQAAPEPALTWLTGLHAWLERHAGWLTLGATLMLAVTMAIVTVCDTPIWPSLLMFGVFLLCVILLFTRPLALESDVNTMFRFGWGFAVATAMFGVLFAYYGFDSSWARGKEKDKAGCTTQECSEPEAQEKAPPVSTEAQEQSEALLASPPDAKLERKPYLLAIVPGCDYDSIPFVNGVAAPTVDNPDTSASSPSNGAAGTSTLRGASGRLTNPGMPEHIYCGELPPQWVLSIGGSILTCHFDGTCPKTLPRPDLAKLEEEIENLSVQLAAQRTLLARANNALRAREGFALARLDSSDLPAGNHSADRDTAASKIGELTAKLRLAQTKLDAARKWDQFHWNIEGGPIVGGVVIPIYFLAIAVLGALVNMTRKLPEFQQRVDKNYPPEFAARVAAGDGPLPPITWTRARDLVVFQILQVLTAPAIAILAYSWATPERISTTVILAFAAGFSSEVFLVAIRGVVDRAIGLGPRPALARAAAEALVPTSSPSVPPRGSSGTAPDSSGGFKKGDAVVLVKPVGPFRPGTTGEVLSIEPDGELIVRTTADHTGMPVQFRLQSQPPESFQHAGAAAPADGPAG